VICLTGDIHHSSLRTGNQRHCDITEVQTARRYLALLEEAGVKVTLFVSGLCFVEDWRDLEPVVRHPLVEVGGHNWSCLTPELWHRFWNKATGSYNGPAWYQDLDARATMAVARWRTGRPVRLWRNHMYMHGPHTDRVLAGRGIALVSDGVKKDAAGPVRLPGGLWSFPINVMPDHEHLYHAERTREWVAAWQKRYAWRDDFGPESYAIGEWTGIVLRQLEENEARGAISCMIVHPITMYLADRFEGFGRILAYLKTRTCAHLSAAIPSGGEGR
jgi:hypothetical protein